MTKKVKNNPSDFWERQKRKTLIESTGASMRLSGSKITNEKVEAIIEAKKSKKE